MKIISFVLLSMVPVLFTFEVARSQITLEHTYNGYTYVANLANSGYKYYALDTQNKTLKLYHPDHSLWKTINLSVPNGYQLMTTVYNVSEDLFSLDGKVGFSYSYYQSTPSYQSETRVMDESGSVLLTIPGANYANTVNVDGDAKLMAYITNYTTNVTTTKVYDLPGNFATGTDSYPVEIGLPFPNPAINTITIPYPAAEMTQGGEILIFDLTGNCIKTYSVDNAFDHLIIPSGLFQKGTYLYKIRNPKMEIGSGKFIVQ